MNTIERLQKWYQSMCDGDWEHAYGVHIETLDNPGWHVAIEIKESDLEGKPFSVVEYGIECGSESKDGNWISCSIKDGIFHGHGGPDKLEEMLTVFLDWAEKNSEPSAAV